MIGMSWKLIATSASSIGLLFCRRRPPPQRMPLPMPECPLWKIAGSLYSAITSYRSQAMRSQGRKPCTVGWSLKPFTPRDPISRRASRAPI